MFPRSEYRHHVYIILSLYYNFIHLTCSDEITCNGAAKKYHPLLTTPQFEVVRMLLCLQNPTYLFPRGKWNQRVEAASWQHFSIQDFLWYVSCIERLINLLEFWTLAYSWWADAKKNSERSSWDPEEICLKLGEQRRVQA